MTFAPDILVDWRDAPGLSLVVETQLDARNADEAERALKRYMASTRCPTGLLVFPDRLRLFRDTFVSLDDQSIALVGEFALGGVLGSFTKGRDAAFAFEDAVQTWLERLPSESARRDLSDPLRRAIEAHVVPAIALGEVHSAGPRWQRTGSD